MSKNKLTDLNDHLFMQMERLSNEDLDAKGLTQEVQRAAAMVGIADKITGNADLQLKAAKLFADHGEKVLGHLPQIGGPKS